MHLGRTDTAADEPGAGHALVTSEAFVAAPIEQRAIHGCQAIEVIDTLPALRAALARGENPYPPNWNGHPNDVGNDAIALAVRRSASLQREHVR